MTRDACTGEGFGEELSGYLDGLVPEHRRRAMEAHLEGCSGCADLLEDLRALRAAARALGPIEPPRDLWPDVYSALEGGARPPRRRGSSVGQGRGPVGRVRPVRRRIHLTVPQLAAAAVALMLLPSAVAWWAGTRSRPATPGAAETNGSVLSASGVRRPATGPGSPSAAPAALPADLAPPSADLARELRMLQEEVRARRDALPPDVARVLDRNLTIIDQAIEDSRRALASDPGNAFLVRHLQRTYRMKASYLGEAVRIASWSG